MAKEQEHISRSKRQYEGAPISEVNPKELRLVVGEEDKTGLIYQSSHSTWVTARHPRWSIDGQQQLGHLEDNFIACEDSKEVRGQLALMYQDLTSESDFSQLSSNWSIGYGQETEGISTENGQIVMETGIELAKGQIEHPHPKQNSPEAVVIDMARWRLNNPQVLCTSVPITGSPSEMKLNRDHPDIGAYLNHAQKIVGEYAHRQREPEAFELFDSFGADQKTSAEELFASDEGLAPWFMNASHLSIGLPHIEVNGKLQVPGELAVNLADLLQSELGSVLLWLTASTPLMYGKQPAIQDTNSNLVIPRDYRLIARHYLPTSGNAQPLRTMSAYHQQTQQAMLQGLTHSLGRSAYISKDQFGEFALIHGATRIRTEKALESTTKTGRVEATGPSATSNLFDEYAKASYLTVLYALALESTVRKTPAVDYVSKYLNLASANRFDHKGVNRAFALRENARTQTIEHEALQACAYVATRFPALERYATTALNRIARLTRPVEYGSVDLHSWLEDEDREGCFGDVVLSHMTAHKRSPEELSLDILEFQQKQAEMILANL